MYEAGKNMQKSKFTLRKKWSSKPIPLHSHLGFVAEFLGKIIPKLIGNVFWWVISKKCYKLASANNSKKWISQTISKYIPFSSCSQCKFLWFYNIIYRTVSNTTTSLHFLLEMLTVPVFVGLYTAESPPWLQNQLLNDIYLSEIFLYWFVRAESSWLSLSPFDWWWWW